MVVKMRSATALSKRGRHEDAVGDDDQDDGEAEKRVSEHEDGRAPHRVEGRQHEEGARRAEAVDVVVAADHHERLQEGACRQLMRASSASDVEWCLLTYWLL